ncbi:sulfurtransferase TusA family protein [Lichenihabitans psoromatis]|uniref:sulfurtransferase TusA family protein n=1 Tax=Lichenihabitans psoromatis TaxID=2528642 RepID=UPI0010385567|nr:sulfurtransferase TusA family protein [Lichenihabitans psoromatis]
MDDVAEQQLDLRGLKCPQPVLRTRRYLRAMAPGAMVEVSCTDPLAAIDIPNLVREMGASLQAIRRDDGVLFFVIRR